jgi:hypothetical protein
MLLQIFMEGVIVKQVEDGLHLVVYTLHRSCSRQTAWWISTMRQEVIQKQQEGVPFLWIKLLG